MPIITLQRAAFLALVLAQMHSPYRWGAKGQPAAKDGPRLFDCSGLVTWAFHQVGGKDASSARTCSSSSA
ncbi:NlpC/P60 family protein [Corallococcus caeni]|uniref:NlpC/P60 family protein n=1 Tax=Corallococcus caeni TaxID=3082388 RepID=UPI0030C7554B